MRLAKENERIAAQYVITTEVEFGGLGLEPANQASPYRLPHRIQRISQTSPKIQH